MKKFYTSDIITVEKLIHGGKGMGHYKGKPVFVPYTLPGEKIRAAIKRFKSKYFDGKVLEILEPSPERVDPPCRYFTECGGCQWQHIDYRSQLKYKERIVRETLQGIGNIKNPNVLSTIGVKSPFHWRTRVIFHGNEKGEIGFYAPNSHRVVDIEECLIAEEAVNEKLKIIRNQPEAIRKQKKNYEVNSSPEKGFTQVHREQNAVLKNIVTRWAKELPHDHIVELYCGNGNFTQGLSQLTQKLNAVDSFQEAIQEAKGKYPDIVFLCTDAVRYFANYRSDTPLDLLVLDPPRDGAAGVVEGVLKSKPKNILYISCNPATLARDLKFLKNFADYRLVQCQPIDMFPQSFHVETVNLISVRS